MASKHKASYSRMVVLLTAPTRCSPFAALWMAAKASLFIFAVADLVVMSIEDERQDNASQPLSGGPLRMSLFSSPIPANAGGGERRPAGLADSHITMTRARSGWAGNAASCMTRRWSAMDAVVSRANMGVPPLTLTLTHDRG